jgi:hypothetical protein
VKHADGKSAEKLRKTLPNRFPQGQVLLPLVGQDFQVSEDELLGYMKAVEDFWLEFTSRLENGHDFEVDSIELIEDDFDQNLDL